MKNDQEKRNPREHVVVLPFSGKHSPSLRRYFLAVNSYYWTGKKCQFTWDAQAFEGSGVLQEHISENVFV